VLAEQPGRSASRDGYEFMLSLTDAIEESTGAFEDQHPGAFRYRDSDLRRAVERELYSRLSGRQDLLHVYCAGGSDVAGVETALEADVVARLLHHSGPVARSRGAGPWRAARSARWKLAPRRSVDRPLGAGGSAGTSVDQAPVAFVLDHPKFLAYLEPVLGALRPASSLVISIVPGVDTSATAAGVRYIPAHAARSMPRPDMTRAGIGLAESWYLCSSFERLDAAISRERPRAVIVVEGNSAVDELTNQICRLRRIPCLCIQQGWSPIVHNGFRHMSFSAMLVWGEGFRELLRPHNPDQHFEVVGSPVFDARANGQSPHRHLHDLVDGAPVVAVFLQGDSPLITGRHREALLGIVRETAGRLPQAYVLVREHPAHPLEQPHRDALGAISNVILAAPDRYPIGDVLDVSTLAVSIYSTTLLESAARGRVPVVFNPTALPRSAPDLEAIGAGVEQRDARAATETVVHLMQDDAARAAFGPGLAAFASRFFDGARPGAARRIGDIIDAATAA
jgi:hypothetical protein